MEAKLTVIGGKASKREVSLKLPATIGRSREADVTVAHPMVSRQHCELLDVDGVLTLRDLGSLNGTLVAGQRISEVALRPNEQFTVGPLTFQVSYEYTGDPAALPPPSSAAVEPQPAEAPAGEEVPDFIAVDEQPPAFAAPAPEVEPADQGAAATPSDGQMPDFDAWAAAAVDQDAEEAVAEPAEEEPQAGLDETEKEPEPIAPPPPVRQTTEQEEPIVEPDDEIPEPVPPQIDEQPAAPTASSPVEEAAPAEEPAAESARGQPQVEFETDETPAMNSVPDDQDGLVDTEELEEIDEIDEFEIIDDEQEEDELEEGGQDEDEQEDEASWETAPTAAADDASPSAKSPDLKDGPKKKGKNWWPFGKGKSKKKGATGGEEPEQEDAEVAEQTIAEPAGEEGPKAPVGDIPAVASTNDDEQSEPPAEPPEESEDAELDDFLKGLQ